MKCENCGFSFDKEAECPICGTPAAQPAAAGPTAPEQPPVQTQLPPDAPSEQPKHDVKQKPEVKQKPQKKQKPPRSGGGLRIATFCVLSVIAAALVAGTALQTVSFFRDESRSSELKKIAESYDTQNNESAKYTDASDAVGSTEPNGRDKALSDDTVRKIGDSYDFGNGILTLKSAEITAQKVRFDDSKQQAAFTVELTNNSKTAQVVDYIEFTVSDSVFDAENYLYMESSAAGDGIMRIGAGEKATFVYHYKLPKENQKLECRITAYFLGSDGISNGSSDEFSASSTYGFETKDIK